MKKIKILLKIFKALTICGAIYVFYTGGIASAGYAVIPLLFYVLFQRWERTIQDNEKQK